MIAAAGRRMPDVGIEPAETGTHAAAEPGTVRALFDRLDAASIPWVLLRDPDSIDDPEAEDVDVLVDRRFEDRLRDLFRANGFVELSLLGRGSHRAFVGLDAAAGRFRRVDVVTRLEHGEWFEQRVPLAAAVLRRRERRDGLWQPAPIDAFWTLALHLLLDKPTVPTSRLPALRRWVAFAEPAEEWSRIVPDSVRASIVSSVFARDGAALAATRAAVRAGSRGQSGSRRRGLAMRERTLAVRRRLERWLEPLPGFRRRVGLTVALLGPDGAGKSTIARAIAARYPLPARTVYLGLWRRSAARDRTGPAIPGSELVPRLLAAWRGWLAGRLLRARGWLVLFDRYPYDALLRADRRSPLASRLYFNLIGRSCPSPDLLLVLDAPGHVLRARKDERSDAELEADRHAYARLAASRPGTRVIRAEGSLAEVERDVLRVIWSEVVARWPR